MDNKEFSKKPDARTKAFAIRIIKLPNTVEGKIVRNQMSGSSKEVWSELKFECLKI